jgi:acetyltransferase-like isoleucine patch superfamily enzyme
MILSFFKQISKGLTKYIFVPINVKLFLFSFSIRHFMFGFENSNKMLEQLSKPCLIPILKSYGATIGKDCDIETGLTFHNCYDYSNLVIGDNCHIGKNCFFDLRGKIIIANNVVISMKTTIITHQDITKSKLSKLYPAIINNVLIDDNCYIGVNSTILKGVIIQENSIVGAGSVVINNILQNTIVGGIPAKEIKKIIGI